MNVNLISDTVTKPSKEMLDFMLNASEGDDVFKKDPTVNQLELKVADLFGMEKSLFFPSGTMTNQTAIKILTNPGDQLICSKYSHVYNYEGGGVSFNSGVSCKLIDGEGGLFKAKDVYKAINPPNFMELAGRNFSINEQIRIHHKKAIAKKACELCETGEDIIIKGGTTTYQMVHYLLAMKLQILTNSFPIAEHLIHFSKNVILISGGTFYRLSLIHI